jgi:hypothetical protein
VIASRWRETKPPLGARVNWGHPLARGLIAAVPANEPGGPMYDLVSGLAMQPNASPTRAFSAAGLASRHDAAARGFLATAAPSHRVSYPITLFACFTRAGSPATGSGVFGITHNLTDASPFTSAILALSSTNIFGYSNDSSNIATVSASLTADGLYRVAAVLTSPQRRIYVNDMRTAAGTTTSTIGGPSYGTAAQLCVGHYAGTSRTSNILFHYGFIWNRELSVDELDAVKANPFALYLPARMPATFYAASTGVTASLSGTLGAFTLSGSATAATPTAANASLSSTLGSATLTGSATSAAPGASTGSLTSTLGAVTLTGAATSAAPGGTNSTLSSTLGSVTLTGSATAGAAGTVTSTLTATLGSATLSGAATSAAPGNTTGTLSATLGSATLSGVVTVSVAGTTATLDATLGSITLSGAATSVAPTGTTASLSATLGSVTFAGIVGAALVNGPTQLGASVVQLGPGGVTFTPSGPTGGTFGAA